MDASQLLSLEQLDGLRALPIMHKSLEDPAMRALLTKVCIARIANAELAYHSLLGCGFPLLLLRGV